MPRYVILSRFTDQGIRNIREFPAVVRENRDRAKALGVTILASYFTVGEYDRIQIIEAPDEGTAMSALLMLGVQGNVRTTTMQAFTLEEMERFIAKIPEDV